MAIEVILPRVDMDMTEGRIARWHVGEGETVSEGDALFEIETDKAAMEVEAPASGVVRGVDGRIDEAIPIGAVVAWICAEGEDAPAATPTTTAAHAAAAEESATVATQASCVEPEPEKTERAASPEPRARATPLARRLAREHAVDLDRLRGSGPRGRVQSEDVRALLERPPAEPEIAPPAEAPAAPGFRRDARPDSRREQPPAARPAAPPVGSAPAARPAAAEGVGALRLLREGAGEPILLLHGFGAEGAMWRSFTDRVALANPLWTLDLPAHGRAQAPQAPGLDGLVRAVEDAVLDAELGPVHLVGHSLGGAVAAALAGGGAVAARSLLLLAPAGLGGAIDQSFLRGVVEAETEAGLDAWLRRLVTDPNALPSGLARATLRARNAPGARENLTTLAAGLFADGAQLFSIAPELARLSAPFRIVQGLADRIIMPDAALAPPQAAVHRLPGVGHMPQLESPDLIARLMAETLRSAA